MTYTTNQGDMWDLIAHKVYGNTAHVVKLLDANPVYNKVFIFSAGVVLQVPELDESDIDTSYLPPWRR